MDRVLLAQVALRRAVDLHPSYRLRVRSMVEPLAGRRPRRCELRRPEAPRRVEIDEDRRLVWNYFIAIDA